VSVRTDSASLGLPNSLVKLTMKGQKIVVNASIRVFFQPGDSGSLVFMVNSESGKLTCIGMAIGITAPASETVVTPIRHVLDALDLQHVQHLKVFYDADMDTGD
jgi:hypothetical protein